MSTPMGSSSTAAQEGAMLLTDVEQPAYDSVTATTTSDEVPVGEPLSSAAAAEQRQDEEEMNNPWPATFERSVKILSKPIVNKELVAFASKSMHILPPTKLRKNTSLSDLNRGWRTPDPESKVKPRIADGDESEDDEGGGVFQRMGIKKTMTLDWHMPPSKAKLTEMRRMEEFQRLREEQSKKAAEMKGEDKAPKDAHGVVVEGDDKTTFGQCVFNVSNTLMGMGILGLPFCLRSAGWAGGLLALALFGAVTWWTSILIGRELNGDPRARSSAFEKDPPDDNGDTLAGKESLVRLRGQQTSFPAICREAFGQRGNIILSSVLYFELFSCLAVFFVSMGDHLHTLFPIISTARHMTTVAVALLVPTVLCKTPKLLSYLSMVGTFTTVTVVLSVFGAAVWEGDISAEMTQQQTQTAATDYHSTFIPTGLPLGFGMVAYCFSGHAVVPSIYNSMARPQDYERMITVSYALVMICSTIVAVSGYYMFGSTVSDQVTISLEQAPIDADLGMMVLTWLMVLTAFSKFTLYLFPLALGMEELIAPYVPSDKVMELSYMLIKFALVASSLFVGICIPSFAFLCSLVGLVCTVIVSVIFPAAAHLKLFGPHLRPWEKFVDWAIILGGLTVGVVGTIATVGA